MKKLLKAFVLVFFFGLGYLFFWPVSIEPIAWNPPDNPGLSTNFQDNAKLAGSERLLEDVGVGPEDVVADEDGRIYVGLLDGRIVRFEPDEPSDSSVVTRTERPLGLAFGPEGVLYFVDAYQGLMKYDPETSTGAKLLSEEAAELPYGFTNDLAVDTDGTVYFTDSSSRYSVESFEKIMLSHSGTGRLLRYDPESGETIVLEDGLNFPNGLTLTADRDALLMVETSEYRVRRYPLEPDGRTGSPETVIGGLPGIPDNINRADGSYWLALPTPRNSMLDSLGPYPWVRKIIARLPKFFHPAPQRHPIVIEIREDGRVLRNLQDRTGDVALVSSAYEQEGRLYLGSYQEPVLRRYDL